MHKSPKEAITCSSFCVFIIVFRSNGLQEATTSKFLQQASDGALLRVSKAEAELPKPNPETKTLNPQP